MSGPGLDSDLPILDPEPDGEDDGFDEGSRSVLITGAAGNLGRKLSAAWAEAYDLVRLDSQVDPDDPDLVVADLSEWDEEWTSLFYDVDTVIHLAANPSEFASWDDLVRPNMDALFHVFHAAAFAGVDRLIFASSNHAMGDYRELGDDPITMELPVRPDGPYGGLKLAGERLGIALAKAYGISFVALRIGWIQRGENRPETMPDEWSRRMWLSNEDAVRLFTCAIEAELGEGEWAVVHGMSANRGSRWSPTEARDRIGFEAKDDAYAG